MLFDSQSEQVPLAENYVETNSEDNLDAETDRVTLLMQLLALILALSSISEIPKEHSCAFGNTCGCYMY